MEKEMQHEMQNGFRETRDVMRMIEYIVVLGSLHNYGIGYLK